MLTTYAADQFLNAFAKNTAVALPTGLQLRLYSVIPTAASTAATPTGTELSGGGYAPLTVPLSDIGATSSTSTNATAGSLTNNTPLTFAAATGPEGTLNDVGICDENGQLWFFGAAGTSSAIVAPDSVTFPAGSLVFSLA